MDRAPPRRAPGAGGASRRQREELFAAWRTFFERMAAAGPGRASSSRISSGLIRAARLHRAPARLGHDLADLRAGPDPARALERRPGWGSGARSATSVTLEPLPDRSCASCCRAWPGSAGKPRDRGLRARGRDPAVRGGDGPDAHRPRPARRRPATATRWRRGPNGSTGSRCPRRCMPSSPLAWTRTAPATVP